MVQRIGGTGLQVVRHMEVVIVTGHFMPEVGYQEVYLARAFSRLGHTVHVIASDRPSPSARGVMTSSYRRGFQRDDRHGYTILRLPATVSAGSLVLSPGLRSALAEISPDLVVVIGVGKLFPLPVLTGPEKRRHRLIALFGDNSDFSNFNKPKARLLRYLVKNRAYRLAVRSCDRLYLYTPETESLLLSSLPDSLRASFLEKRVASTLGYDPEEFYFDGKERRRVRDKLKITEEEVVFITSTRITPEKRIDEVVPLVSRMRKEGKKVRYIIIGCLADPCGRRLKSLLEKQPDPGIFLAYPFLDHGRVREFCCASDLGVWTRPSISIQEAMGTGLPVVLARRPGLMHLVQQGANGWYFEMESPSPILEKAYSEVAERDQEARLAWRRQLAARNRHNLSYHRIAESMLVWS
ncbi:MAG: glycosyltransferase family 4 protein [Deltaproteobacteria bacterium]|nr:glycosyltransferase family 4 protein [Deltaproteobacteria bacterium]